MLALQGKSGARVPSGQGWDVKGWPQGAAALENHLLCFPLKHLRITPVPPVASAWTTPHALSQLSLGPCRVIRPVVPWATSGGGHMGQEDCTVFPLQAQ